MHYFTVLQFVIVHLLRCSTVQYNAMCYFTALQFVTVHLLQCNEMQSSAIQCSNSLHCILLQCIFLKGSAMWWCFVLQCIVMKGSAMQCNLQLPSQLVNLLFLDWTRSSELGKIANLLFLNFCDMKFFWIVFGQNYVCLVNMYVMFLCAHQQQFCCQIMLIFLAAITNWCGGNFEEEHRPAHLSRSCRL